ncbi:MAG: acetolactate synthase small subunit [Polyangiales bacterium]
MSQPTARTFSVYVEDKPGVLNRVASLFRRRNYNIESLNVGRTHEPGVSRMTIVCDADADTAKRIEANLYKLVNVLWVDDITDKRSIDRVLALVKLRVPSEDHRKVFEISEKFPVRILDTSSDTITVEITGHREKVQERIEAFRQFEIVELVQTGTVSMRRGVDDHAMAHPTVPASRIDAA